jgi:tRNA A-37 threonylcarbamoyl transferase component Bud32
MLDQLVGKKLGNYEVTELIGKGGMAAVYKAYQPSMNRNVAIKVLTQQSSGDRASVQRFENEARLIAQLEHAHILPVYDFGEQEGILYIVMRYLPAGTLADRIPEGGMPLKEAVNFFAQLASALHYAHSRGVIHRDLKPSNVLVDQQNNVFLSDFGIAKSLEGTQNLTGTGGVVGTPTYMSPEQGLGETLDARSDIYALGVILYEMLTGRPPYIADNPMAVMLKHINDPVPEPRSINPDIPPEVEAVILKALAKAPDQRYQTAKEMADELEQAAAVALGITPSRLKPAAPADAATLPAAPVGGKAQTAPAPLAGLPGGLTGAGLQTVVPPEEVEVHLNRLSTWLKEHAVIGTWIQSIMLSLATFIMLQRLTQDAVVETALLSLIPGVLLYGLLRAPTVGALVSFVLILAPLLPRVPGVALIWLAVAIIAAARLNSREIMLTLVTVVAAGSPLGWLIPLLAPWWLRTRRTVLPVALGVLLAMMFAMTLGWRNAGGLLPVPVEPVSPDSLEAMQLSPFDTTYLGVLDNRSIWENMAQPDALLTSVRATFDLLGQTLIQMRGLPLFIAAGWALAAVLSTSNSRVQTPLLRMSGPALGLAALLAVHLLLRPEGLEEVQPVAVVLAVISAALAFGLSQWPIQADPNAGNKAGTLLRLLVQVLGAVFMALGVGYFVSSLGGSPLYDVSWLGGTAGVIAMITNPLAGALIVFASLAVAFVPVQPVLAGVVGGLLILYLGTTLLFDRRRPRYWSPLGAGFIIGAPGLAGLGILPLGPLSIGVLELQVPAAILGVLGHVLMVATAPEPARPLSVIVQVVTTLAGVLLVERLMGMGLLGQLGHKLRRLIFTVGTALIMALLYYTLGRVAPGVSLLMALPLSAISAILLVTALGDRAMFWRRFIEPEEKEEEFVEDEVITGPWSKSKQPK